MLFHFCPKLVVIRWVSEFKHATGFHDGWVFKQATLFSFLFFLFCFSNITLKPSCIKQHKQSPLPEIIRPIFLLLPLESQRVLLLKASHFLHTHPGHKACRINNLSIIFFVSNIVRAQIPSVHRLRCILITAWTELGWDEMKWNSLLLMYTQQPAVLNICIHIFPRCTCCKDFTPGRRSLYIQPLH